MTGAQQELGAMSFIVGNGRSESNEETEPTELKGANANTEMPNGLDSRMHMRMDSNSESKKTKSKAKR